MRFQAIGPLCLLFVPWAAAFPKPGVGIDLEWKRDPLDLRPRIPAILPGVDETSTTANTSTPPTSTSTPPTSTATTPTSTSTTSTPTSTTPTTTPTSAPASHSSAVLTTNDDGEVVTRTVQVPASSTTSSAAPTTTEDTSSSGPGKGTYIGLGVAGGVAVLGLCGFIVWKFTQKRFSQFDDDGEDIKWPMPKEELAQPPAPPTMSAATNATNSSVDLSHDPYAVPPLPPQRTGPYYDDPSGTPYYDPYRGPVPHTFNSPPPSSDGHIQQYAMGEAIPMSTYSSSNGRQSPGPNMAYADPYARTRSPGPNMTGYEDPYAAGRRSPGPSLAYGMEPARVGTPVGGYGAPGVPPGLDVPRVGTPQSYGRASPAIPAGYAVQQPLVNPYGRSTPNPYGS